MCSVSIAGADFFSSDPVVGGGSIKSAAAAEATAAPPNNKDDFKNPLRFFYAVGLLTFSHPYLAA
jgi:hypothetical protein